MFNKCLMGELRNKTRILVTNQLQFVSPADTAIFMSAGRIAEIGSYSSLMSRGDSFAQLMSQAEVLLLFPFFLTDLFSRTPRLSCQRQECCHKFYCSRRASMIQYRCTSCWAVPRARSEMPPGAALSRRCRMMKR